MSKVVLYLPSNNQEYKLNIIKTFKKYDFFRV